MEQVKKLYSVFVKKPLWVAIISAGFTLIASVIGYSYLFGAKMDAMTTMIREYEFVKQDIASLKEYKFEGRMVDSLAALSVNKTINMLDSVLVKLNSMDRRQIVTEVNQKRVMKIMGIDRIEF